MQPCQRCWKSFHGGEKAFKLWTLKEKVHIPLTMQNKAVDWCHNRLLHPGHNRTEETISQHLWWPKLTDNVREHVKTCSICQKNKRNEIKYGHVPPKEAETKPWDKMYTDSIGPYKIRRKGRRPVPPKPGLGWQGILNVVTGTEMDRIDLPDFIELYNNKMMTLRKFEAVVRRHKFKPEKGELSTRRASRPRSSARSWTALPGTLSLMHEMVEPMRSLQVTRRQEMNRMVEVVR